MTSAWQKSASHARSNCEGLRSGPIAGIDPVKHSEQRFPPARSSRTRHIVAIELSGGELEEIVRERVDRSSCCEDGELCLAALLQGEHLLERLHDRRSAGQEAVVPENHCVTT